MCTVLLRFAPGSASPLRLGAVRDEFVDRAWDPPGAHWGDRLLGGRDWTAGGTWLAVDPDRPAGARWPCCAVSRCRCRTATTGSTLSSPPRRRYGSGPGTARLCATSDWRPVTT